MAPPGRKAQLGCAEQLVGREGHVEAVDHVAAVCTVDIELDAHLVVYLLVSGAGPPGSVGFGYLAEDEGRKAVPHGGGIEDGHAAIVVGIGGGGAAADVEAIGFNL